MQVYLILYLFLVISHVDMSFGMPQNLLPGPQFASLIIKVTIFLFFWVLSSLVDKFNWDKMALQIFWLAYLYNCKYIF